MNQRTPRCERLLLIQAPRPSKPPLLAFATGSQTELHSPAPSPHIYKGLPYILLLLPRTSLPTLLTAAHSSFRLNLVKLPPGSLPWLPEVPHTSPGMVLAVPQTIIISYGPVIIYPGLWVTGGRSDPLQSPPVPSASPGPRRVLSR